MLNINHNNNNYNENSNSNELYYASEANGYIHGRKNSNFKCQILIKGTIKSKKQL